MLVTGFVDALSVGYLLAFALAMRTIAQKLPQTEHSFIAPVLGAIAMTVYFVEHAPVHDEDLEQLTISVIRTLCVYQITAGMLTVLLAIGLWRRSRPKRVSPWQRRRFAQLANKEFESERRLLQRLPLDDDEREVLLMQAKQRLLQ